MGAIYLDNAASTRVHPDVVDAMLPYLGGRYGNPSSIHRSGRTARRAVDRARRQVASLINAEPSEIFFTSGGTESDNMALRGVARAASHARRTCRIITSVVEHDAILEPCRDLAREGADVVATAAAATTTTTTTTAAATTITVDYLPVDKHGVVDVGILAKMLGAEGGDHNGVGCVQESPLLRQQPVVLVSIMYANNEVGTIQPVSEIARICHEAGAVFHTDAVQAAGKIPVDIGALGVDIMSISSHKIHGPKGVGALYLRGGTGLEPWMLGGGQEGGMRSGTENVAGVVGFGRACEIARRDMDDNISHTRRLRDLLVRRILGEIPASVMNGDPSARLPGNAHFTFFGVNGEDLLIKLDEHGIAASTGSACSMNTQKASHVLEAMGFTHEQITGSLRLTPDVFNTDDEVNTAVDVLKEVVRELRAVSPFKSKYLFGDGGGDGSGADGAS